MTHRLPQILHLDLELAFASDQIVALILILTLIKLKKRKNMMRNEFKNISYRLAI